MPMDFPDMQSLLFAAKIHKFRFPIENEIEEDYREALANHVSMIDFLESEEIRYKVGWDRFTNEQNLATLKRKGFF